MKLGVDTPVFVRFGVPPDWVWLPGVITLPASTLWASRYEVRAEYFPGKPETYLARREDMRTVEEHLKISLAR